MTSNKKKMLWRQATRKNSQFYLAGDPIIMKYNNCFVLNPKLNVLNVLYTTPLSLIISQSSVNHKLYADDTQLFLSFSADAFSENILLLQNTISNISSWMVSNFLTLNPSKTEFLLIGLPAQLSKIHNPTLTISSNTTIQPACFFCSKSWYYLWF